MFKLTRLIHLADATTPADLESVATRLREAVAGAQRRLVEPTLPGSRNGGDLLLHAQFDTEKSWTRAESALTAVLSEPPIAHVDGVDYQTESAPVPNTPGTVYRTLLLAVAPDTPSAVVERFEADLLLMPRFVATITACALNRPIRALGTSRWTHVFEQEFTDEAGLAGAYLMHPIHWARVDRWFDPECPECIVQERVCHSYSRCHRPVLATRKA